MKKIYETLGKATIETGILLLIVFIVERLELFALRVTYFNQKLIFPYEVGGFFFILLLIASLIVEGIAFLYRSQKK